MYTCLCSVYTTCIDLLLHSSTGASEKKNLEPLFQGQNVSLFSYEHILQAVPTLISSPSMLSHVNWVLMGPTCVWKLHFLNLFNFFPFLQWQKNKNKKKGKDEKYGSEVTTPENSSSPGMMDMHGRSRKPRRSRLVTSYRFCLLSMWTNNPKRSTPTMALSLKPIGS